MESGNTNAHCSASDASSPTGECSSRSSKTAQLRGPSRKLLVEVWSNGQIVGPNASNFKTAIGNEVRLHIPINTKDWRLVKDDFKDAIWNALTVFFFVLFFVNSTFILFKSHHIVSYQSLYS